MIFWDPSHFANSEGVTVAPETQIERQIPPQVAQSDLDAAETMGTTVQIAILVVAVSIVVLSPFISFSLQSLLGMIKQMQISCHIMLINVQTPANVTIFYGYIFQVMALDLIDCDNFFDQKLQLKETEPLSHNFDKIGYGSLYSIRNFGSLFFVFMLAPTILALANLIGLCNFECCKKLKAYVNKAFFWNGIIGFLYENYMLICVCWMLNVTHFEWDGVGDTTNSLFTLFLIFLSGGLLVHVCVFYRKNASKIENREEHVDFNERRDFLYMDFDVKELKSKVMWLPIATLLR